MNVVLLSTYANPLLPLYLENILGLEGIRVKAVVLDQKDLTEYQLSILRDRLLPGFMSLKLSSFDEFHVPFYFVKNHNSENAINLYKSLNVHFLINCGTPRILKGGIVEASEYKILNVHPGVLPKYRGCSAVEWSIYNDDLLGNTLHLISQGIDEGDIIKVKYYIPTSTESYKEIRTNIYKDGAALIAKVLIEMSKGEISQKNFYPQEDGSYWKPIDECKFSMVREKISNGSYLEAIKRKHLEKLEC